MIDDGNWQGAMQAQNIAAFSHKVERITADSHSAFANEMLFKIGGEFDLIMIDGDHSFDGVVKDIDMVLPYAGPETLIGFHDVYASEEAPEVGPAMWSAMSQGKIKLVANFFKREGVFTPLGFAVCRKAGV
jgi:hypothetical protein